MSTRSWNHLTTQDQYHLQEGHLLSQVAHFKQLQKRVATLVGLVLLSAILVAGASGAYIIFVAKLESGLVVSGGMLLLVFLVGLLSHFIGRQYIIRPLTQLEAELDRLAQNKVSATTDWQPDTEESPTASIEEIHAVSQESQTKQKPDVEESPYRLLAEYANDIISRHTPDGVYLYASPACRTLLEYDPDELVGSPIYEFLHPEDSVKVKKYFSSASKPSDANTFSYRIRRKGGQYLWLETTSKAVRTPETGGIQEIIAVSRDISGRKRVEAQIIESNRQLTVFQSAGVAITSSLNLRYVLDTVAQQMVRMFDVENCTISEWNQTTNTVSQIAQFGPAGWWDPKSPAKIRRLSDYPLTAIVLDEQIPEQMTINQSNIDPAECIYMREANIKTRVILPMIFKKHVLGLVELEDSREERVFTYQEISLAKLLSNQAASAIENARLFEQAQQEIVERQRAEAALEKERALLAERVKERTAELSIANAKLAKAARLKDEFLASMSHELRTPLNAILGSAEILQTEVFGSLNEKQIRYAHNVEESGRHLLSLINDILDLSKVEAGKVELDIRPVAVKSVCEASLRMIKQMAHKKEILVSHTFDEKITKLMADERRLKQMLVNLLSNAVKFTPAGGKIGLEVMGDADQQIVHFVVWDTGIGIAPEDIERLFQPFIQLDSSLAREHAGTGLGLSLVSRMAEMHGGGVLVESKVGQGSRFTVSLPWRETTEIEQKTETTPVKATPVRSTRPETPLILLAEDNEDNINNFVAYLQAQGYQMVVARNGGETIERVKEKTPDVILMDIQMPGMDGLEATRRLRADASLPKIPIIALTALAMPGDRERCLEAGASEYLSKPVSLKELVKTIETLLN